MKKPTATPEELEQRLEELTQYVLQVEIRLEQLTQEVEQMAAYQSSLRESLRVMGVTEGYSPPQDDERKGGFDPSVG